MNVSDFGKGLKDESRNEDEKGNTMGVDVKSPGTYFSLQTNEVTERNRSSQDYDANNLSSLQPER